MIEVRRDKEALLRVTESELLMQVRIVHNGWPMLTLYDNMQQYDTMRRQQHTHGFMFLILLH